MTLTKKILIAVVVLLVLAQLVPQSVFPLTNPSSKRTDSLQTTAKALTPEVSKILDRSCRDCHSNLTNWPWYSKVAPVFWLLSRDVRVGRKELNFSDWSQYPPRRKDHKLKAICDQVERGEMPLWFYLPMHPVAKLSDADKKAICAWTKQERAAVGYTGPGAGEEHHEH
jgi:hypothetical protein